VVHFSNPRRSIHERSGLGHAGRELVRLDFRERPASDRILELVVTTGANSIEVYAERII
jgi:hypothetical protein